MMSRILKEICYLIAATFLLTFPFIFVNRTITPQNNVGSQVSLTFDPSGFTVTSTTVPVTIGSTTYSLSLATPSGSIKFGLIAPSVQSQMFLNQSGNFAFQFLPGSAPGSTTLGEFGCKDTSSCTVDLTPLITVSGTYPFAIFLSVGGVTNSVTGTLNVQ